jgi:hypothetical protein
MQFVLVHGAHEIVRVRKGTVCVGEYVREWIIVMLRVRFVRAPDCIGLLTCVVHVMWFALWIVVPCIVFGIVVPFIALYYYYYNLSLLEYKHCLIALLSMFCVVA